MKYVPLFTALIILHRVDGAEVTINPAAVTSLHATASSAGRLNKLLDDKVQCAIGLIGGRLVSVRESCATVRQMIEEGTK